MDFFCIGICLICEDILVISWLNNEVNHIIYNMIVENGVPGLMLSRNDCFIAVQLSIALIAGLLHSTSVFSDGWDPDTKASNRNSIMNTRHNLTQSYIPGGFGNFMDYARNNYGEVCVYCHTPHGASKQVSVPLWNRTINTSSYQIYNIALMSGQSANQPGASSLACLSCHDGTVAIDSVINMPGSGGYLATQETSQSATFLNSWSNPSGIETLDHGVISSPSSSYFSGPYNCNRCHTTGNVWGIADFTPFNIGTDLINDHPIGVTLPDNTNYDFRVATGFSANEFEFFDDNGNNEAETNEVRLYFDGSAYRIECATCHDPHGVAPSPGAEMYPSFLRKSNGGSALCLTCHLK